MDDIGDFQFMGPNEYSKGEVPWSLRPEQMSTPSDAEREQLENIRRVWLQLIDRRVASYGESAIGQPTPLSPLVATRRPDSDTCSASNRVFGATELLENILRHTSSSAHLIALGVCHKWRDVALHIMRPSSVDHDFGRAYPCPPVKFGDAVSRQLNWLPATVEELDYLDDEQMINLNHTRDGLYRGIWRWEYDQPHIIETVCYPGRITMSPNITSEQIYGSIFFYREQLEWSGVTFCHPYHARDVYSPKWVDVTQFRWNKYFESLFQDAFEITNGLCEISLRPSFHMGDGSTWYSLPPAAMSYLATQYITQPPVVSLNVSTWIPVMVKPRVRKALHIVNVRNKDGIRVSELLTAMKAASGLAVEHWKYWARLLHAAVNNGHPRQDFWVVDGRPKLLISLDPFLGRERHVEWGGSTSTTWLAELFYLTCMHALPSRDKRQTEWVPKESWYSAMLE